MGKPAARSPAPREVQGLERFREVVRSQHLKRSRVREAIARVALAYEGHFNAHDLVRVLRAEGVKGAHLATVYRALPVLTDAGLIQPAALTKGEAQAYEASFGRPQHEHLRCKVCGLVVEYRSKKLHALQEAIAARHGFELDEYIHELRGRCRQCRRAASGSAGTTRLGTAAHRDAAPRGGGSARQKR
jgi:Fur family transcriptional regulator, ferric uptake regulator